MKNNLLCDISQNSSLLDSQYLSLYPDFENVDSHTIKSLPSPLNYTGSKHNLLPQILPLFPKNIDSFIDLFCGGASVGINVARLGMAKRILINDCQKELIRLFTYFKTHSLESIFAKIDSLIHSFTLSNTAKYGYDFYKCDSSKGLSSYNKRGFLKLRESYNKDKDILKLFVLIVFSFNNQIRFNAKGEFNLPCGKRDFNIRMQEKLKDFVEVLQYQNIGLIDFDFREILESLLSNSLNKPQTKQKDTKKHSPETTISNTTQKQKISYYLQAIKPDSTFIYADPPYLLANATYNENKAWRNKDERDLLELLQNLDSKGFSFALSNVLYHKGKEHNILQEWLESNPHFTVHYLDYNYKNSNYQTKRLESKEVLIVNYLE